MSSVKETRLWGWLTKARKTMRSQLHMTRIENSVGRGTADVEGCLNGTQFWIELKVYAKPARPSTKIKVLFELAQRPWLTRRIKAGGDAWVLVQVGPGRKAGRYLVWAHSDLTKELAAGVTEERLADMASGNPRGDATSVVWTAAGIPV